MKIFAKKISCVVMIAFLATAQTANSTGLQSMWNSNVTAGGNIDTKDRHAFVGGSAVYRTPISSIQLFNFSPPHVSAGCSGADIYMGSFSYVNKDQIVSTLKAIMNNAQGLLFQAAIEFVSPMISGLMAKFNDLAQKLNSMQMNSCQIATSMMGPINKAASEYGESLGKDLANSGTIGDWLTCKTDTLCNNNPSTQNAEDKSPSMGNTTWKGLANAKSGSKVTYPLFNVPADAVLGPQYVQEILLSMLGSFVKTTSITKDPKNVDAYPIDPKLGFYDLLKGGEGKYKWTCDEPVRCLTPSATALTFVDAETYVEVMMNGNPAWLSLADTQKIKDKLNGGTMTTTVNGTNMSLPVDPTSISARIAGATNGNKALTTEQAIFLDIMPAPVVSMIRKMHGNEYSNIPYLTTKLKHFMALEIVDRIANASLMAISGMESSSNLDGSGNPIPGAKQFVELSQDVKDRIVELRGERTKIADDIYREDASIQSAMAYVDAIVAARDQKNN
ncbi:MAG: conjugal transfer protein TraH [Sideroxydans sp.]|nr:conjugal transfer protein TraH [Sideroxydans sp.]MDD5056616.1 conjugal transfer protein TraH [Sideroxydans sp.]